jgi:Uma2 family endonuclease
MSDSLPLHKFTVDEYERMIEIGILREDERVELILGELIEMSPIGGRHVACVATIDRTCQRQLGDGVCIFVQSPVQLPNDSEPQPDLALVRAGYDEGRVPSAEDIYLVIEAADTSLEYDRSQKLPLYAMAGIPEAWLVNLIDNRIERHTDPGPTGYQTVAFAERGQRLASLELPDLAFDATYVLGLESRQH